MTVAGALPDAVRDALVRFLDALYAAGQDLNLTRIPRSQAWERHVLESLALLDARSWVPGEHVVDLGSGGGVPGIPLALARPDLRCVLVEKSVRKAAILGRLVAELGLARTTVIAASAEIATRTPGWHPADVVVSRAAAAPPELVRLALPLLRPGGELLAHVGGSASVDRALAAAAAGAGGSRPVIMVVPPVRLLRVRCRSRARSAPPGGSPLTGRPGPARAGRSSGPPSGRGPPPGDPG
ncbi:MAG TPA: RsmG family class I SAM-dependent methyltransferase [Verrucomicrobiae bacterium]|nr:RsmG family class I SAM-dependent methyltransferase [Verrucomicrobiae bacterium]